MGTDYILKCDNCKKVIDRNVTFKRSVSGGLCHNCRNNIAPKRWKQDKKICVKDDTKAELKRIGKFGETYNDIIKRLINK